jgi:hypothetical protein
MKYRAKFTPQAWVNDYAVPVDPEGPAEWDCTDYVQSLTHEQFLEVMEPDTYASDDVRSGSNAPAWVKDWTGPFYITVERE